MAKPYYTTPEYKKRWRERRSPEKKEEDAATARMYSQLYYWANEDACKTRNKKWHKDNAAYHSGVSCAWARANPEKVKAIKRKCDKNRRAKDPAYKIRRSLGHRIRIALRAAKASKSFNTMSLVGCSMGRLMEYITAHFQPGMNWLNHGNEPGKWTLDHKRPLVSFNLLDPEEQKLACNYLNLQPLWYEENRDKSDTYPWPRQAQIDRSVNCFSRNKFPLSGNRESGEGQLIATL